VGVLIYAFLPGPVAVDLAPVSHGLLRVTVDEDGKTRIKERYLVSAPLAGRLLRVELHPGDEVKAGTTVVAILDPTDPALLDVRALAEAEARVKAAETSQVLALAKVDLGSDALELAGHDFERAKTLLATKGGTREDFDRAEHKERMARLDLKAAKLAAQVAAFELDLARAALIRTRPPTSGKADANRLEIRSPIDGTVLRVFQESATVVAPGTRLLEVGDPADLEVEIDVLSSDAVKVAPGAKVLLEQWGSSGPLLARVRLVEPAAFLKVSALGVEEQRVNVIADLVDPLEKRKRLGDAFRVEARIVVWEGDKVLKVPAGALFRHGDGWAVFVALKGRAQLRPVQAGHGNGLETEILQGLQESDQVIIHPSDKVKDGVAILSR
jgi:HlyD family secretion protein